MLARQKRNYAPRGLALRIVFYAAVIWVLAGPFVSHAANVAEGGRLAQTFCSQCHVVTRGGQAGWTDAPSFVAIANKPTTTSASLQAFIQKPHMNMLNLARNPSEAADLAAYILILRQK
jgi:cytochrome c